jgi:hypothetical protein
MPRTRRMMTPKNDNTAQQDAKGKETGEEQEQ